MLGIYKKINSKLIPFQEELRENLLGTFLKTHWLLQLTKELGFNNLYPSPKLADIDIP